MDGGWLAPDESLYGQVDQPVGVAPDAVVRGRGLAFQHKIFQPL
jgi:hypothetical protein